MPLSVSELPLGTELNFPLNLSATARRLASADFWGPLRAAGVGLLHGRRRASFRVASARFGQVEVVRRERPNPALDPVRFALWTLRDEAAQRRSASR